MRSVFHGPDVDEAKREVGGFALGLVKKYKLEKKKGPQQQESGNKCWILWD